jgi:hypothetical protein
MNDAVMASLGIIPCKGLSPMRQAFYFSEIARIKAPEIPIFSPDLFLSAFPAASCGTCVWIGLTLMSEQLPRSTGIGIREEAAHSLLTP